MYVHINLYYVANCGFYKLGKYASYTFLPKGKNGSRIMLVY